MGLPRTTPKTSGLLEAAIRKLRDIHGSTSREITNYVATKCDSPAKTIQRHMKLALRRGLSTGVLHRSKDGYYTCAPLDDLEPPDDRSRRGRCGRKRRVRRCSKRRSRRRRGGKKRCGRRRRRKRRGKCGRKRRPRSRSRGSRRRRKCGGGRRRADGTELEELADCMIRQQAAKRTRAARPRSRNGSKTSSQTRVSSASSGGTGGSGADTTSATLSASGKESLTDQSDISGATDETARETKP